MPEIEWDYKDLEMGEIVRVESNFKAVGKCLRCGKEMKATSWSKTNAANVLRGRWRLHVRRVHPDNIPIVNLI